MKEIIESAFEDRAHLTPESANSEIKEAVAETINLLDSGKARVAEQNSIGNWQVNEWLKKAVLLSFRLDDNEPMAGGYTQYFDKVLRSCFPNYPPAYYHEETLLPSMNRNEW